MDHSGVHYDTKKQSNSKGILIILGIVALSLLIVGGIIGLLMYIYAHRDEMCSALTGMVRAMESRFRDASKTKEDLIKGYEAFGKTLTGRTRRDSNSTDMDGAELYADCWERFFTETQNLVCLKRADSNGQSSVNPDIPNLDSNANCNFPRMLTEQMLFQTFRQLRCKQIVDDPID